MTDSRRLFKQIFIVVIYLVIFSGLGTGVYFLVRPTPMPPTPPAPTIYPLEVVWAQSFVAGPGVYAVGARITNPNSRFGSDRFTYTFYLYDANGALLAARSGVSFIWPGESKYLIDAGINGLSSAPVKAELIIGEPDWHEAVGFGGVNLSLTNINYGKGAAGSGKFYMVDFAATNGTSYDLARVYVSAVVFDSSNLPIAVNSTVLENLSSKERRSVSIPWFTAFSGTPARVDLSVSTNLWERPELLNQ